MKCALVTGGSRGIGRAVSVKLAADGYYVLVNFLSNITEAEKTLDLIRSAGGEGELLQFNVADAADVKKTLGGWIEVNNDKIISVLVNNAGITKDNLMVFIQDDEWKDVTATNMDSFFYVTREVLKDMLVNKWGRIINIVSLSGLKGLPGQVNYSAAKGAVIAATKALASEIGKKKVTVNAVAPGFIKTDMTDGLDEKVLKKTIPLNRFGEPEEVAELVSFLASEKSSYITGEIISINGGIYS
jgi:3-oxoacyl-[acyl-carrier protein] reductase